MIISEVNKHIFIFICIESSNAQTEKNFFNKFKEISKNINSKYLFEVNHLYFEHSLKEKNKQKICSNLQENIAKYLASQLEEYTAFYHYLIFHDNDSTHDIKSINETYNFIKTKIYDFTNNEFVVERFYDDNASFDSFIFQLFNLKNTKPPTNSELKKFVNSKKIKNSDGYFEDLKTIIKSHFNVDKTNPNQIVEYFTLTKSSFSKMFKKFIEIIKLEYNS